MVASHALLRKVLRWDYSCMSFFSIGSLLPSSGAANNTYGYAHGRRDCCKWEVSKEARCHYSDRGTRTGIHRVEEA